MRPSGRRRRHASAQALLPLDEVSGDVIRLRGGDHRAVLEAGSVNFALKSEAEQEAILAAYRRFLNALAYPVQVLVRVVPTDVERYLEGLHGRAGGAGRARDGHTGDLWRRLAQDHEAFVRRIARERTLLDRRCYVVIPAGTGGAFERTGIAWPWRRGPEAAATQPATAARRALAFRCAEVAQGLAACGVPTRRLAGDELVALWRAAPGGHPGHRGRIAPAVHRRPHHPAHRTHAGGHACLDHLSPGGGHSRRLPPATSSMRGRSRSASAAPPTSSPLPHSSRHGPSSPSTAR